MEERRREKEEREGRRKEKGGGGASATGHAPRRSSPPLAGDEGDPGTASPDSTTTQGTKPPRLSAFVPCMSLTALVPYVDVWAFVPYVDVWAFVPYICCRPSCRLFSCKFWKTSPYRGGSAEIFNSKEEL